MQIDRPDFIYGFDDNTHGDAGTSAHGLLKKLPNDSSKFLNGIGEWATVAAGGGGASSMRQSPLSGGPYYNNSAVRYRSASLDAYLVATSASPISLIFPNGSSTPLYTHLTSNLTFSTLKAYSTSQLLAVNDGSNNISAASTPYGVSTASSLGLIVSKFESFNTQASIYYDDTAFQWTLYNSAAISTTQYKYGTSSLYCPATGYATVTNYNKSLPSYWSVEFYVYLGAIGVDHVLLSGNCGTTTSLKIYVSSTNYINIDILLNDEVTSVSLVANSIALSATTWYHIAVVFDGGRYQVYLDGAYLTGSTQTLNIFNDGLDDFTWTLGDEASTAAIYFDNFRFTPWTRYSGPFTPVTIAIDSGHVFRGVDNKSMYADFEISTVTSSTYAYKDKVDNTFVANSTGAYLSNSVVRFDSYALRLNATTAMMSSLSAPTFTSPWEIGFWFRLDAVATQQLIFQTLPVYGIGLQLTSGGALQFAVGSGSSSYNILSYSGSYAITANTWYFVSMSWDGSTYRCYCGPSGGSTTLVASASNSAAINAPTSINFGSSSSSMVGYIDDFYFTPYPINISTGTVPTTAFGVPTLYWQDSGTGKSWSGSPGNWTQIYFKTVGTATTGSAGVTSVTTTNQFTLYNNRASANNAITGGGLKAYAFADATTPILYTFANGIASTQDYLSSVIASINSWTGLTPYAMPYLYVDYNSGTPTYGSSNYVPQFGYGPTSFVGKGAGCIVATFEGNNADTTYTDLVNNPFTLSSATISTTQFKFGSSSLRIGAATYYATTPAPTYQTTPWTIEFFVRLDAIGSAQNIFVAYSLALASQPIAIGINASNYLTLYLSSTGVSYDIANGRTGITTLSATTWYHIALSFDGMFYRLHLNGSLEIGVSSSTSTLQSTSFMFGYTSAAALCYIDDFVYTPYAKYTSVKYTVPTSAATPPTTLHFFDYLRNIMYYGNPIVGWTKCNRLFVAYCLMNNYYVQEIYKITSNIDFIGSQYPTILGALSLPDGVIKAGGSAPQLSIQDSSGRVMGLFEYGTSTGLPSVFSTINASSNFISGRIFNAVWNDIAEQVPSDGSLKPGDLAFVDITHDTFRVTKYQGINDAFIGIVSGDPGMIVGLDKTKKNPIFIGLKGQLTINIKEEEANYFTVGRRLYFCKNGVLKDSLRMYHDEFDQSKLIGVIIEKHKNHLKIFV